MAKDLGVFNSASVSEHIKGNDQRTHVFSIISTGITGTVKVRVEGSFGGDVWDNVDEDGDYEITTNKTHNLIVTKILPVASIRFRFVSGTGNLQVYYLNY